jgi:hypothetical protein
MRILFPGQPCPSWLESIEFKGGTNCSQCVGTLSVVTVERVGGKRCYVWRRVFPVGAFIFIDGKNVDVSISGQSPDGDGASVRIMADSAIFDWPLLMAVATGCAYLLGRG